MVLQKNQVLSRIIIEILGKPKEHVSKTLQIVADKLKETKDIKIEHIEIAEPEPVENEDIFTTFLEAELIAEDLNTLLGVCFYFMPRSVEIMEPEDIRIKANQLSGFMNDLQARLHEVDMRLKTVNEENNILNQNAMAVLHNFIIHSLREKERDIAELSKIVGVQEKALEKIIEILVNNNFVKKEGDKYRFALKE